MTISNVLTLEAALLGHDQLVDAPHPALVVRAQRRRPLLLRRALEGGAPGAAAMLLAHGWRPDLHDCAALGDVAGLTAHLADLAADARDPQGATALHYAATHGHAEVVSRLLAAGAHVRCRWHRDLEPIHLASAAGHLAVVERLLAAGARHDAEDAAGFRPLHSAAAAGHAPVVRRLLLAGADPHTPVGTATAVDLARRAGCQLTLGLLKQVVRPDPLFGLSRR